nr:MAG TPA: hypothetical protein [Caudoviricetes sp.]
MKPRIINNSLQPQRECGNFPSTPPALSQSVNSLIHRLLGNI